jgi:hypothetical protein
VRLIAFGAIGAFTLVFAIVNGVLMCASPRRHAAFVRWYTRSRQDGRPDTGMQIQLRIAGLIIVAISMFMSWKFIEIFVGL